MQRTLSTIFWLLAIVLGAVQTWYVRHNMIADGVSYLEIASNYLRGNWNQALNPYWSPLYSWVIALAFAIIRPTPYWQLATLHLVNLSGFLLGLGALEWLLREISEYRLSLSLADTNSAETRLPLSDRALRVIAYASHIYAGLILIGTGFCSPDLLAICLTYALGALTVRMSRTRAASWMFVAAGLLCGVSFLARTAFLTLIPIYLFIFAAILRRERRTLWKPLCLTLSVFASLALPFIAAISLKEHRLTFGDSGRLNYGWEVCGAARWMHWQGEPYDIGKPLHPTTKISNSPIAYTFDNDQPGTYSPWYNPSYWYAGIQPHLKLRPQLKVFLYNTAYAARLLLSPLVVPGLLVVVLAGGVAWRAGFRQWWMLFVPPTASILIYCLVFLDKRYVAGCLVLIWLSTACCIRMKSLRRRVLVESGMVGFVCVMLLFFVVTQFRSPAKLAFQDLLAGRERERNLHALLVERFEQLGLKPGDKIAYVGVTFNADWTRLDDVKIIGEVPVTYFRRWTAFSNNVSHDDLSQLEAFWNADDVTQARILNAFKKAGARMVVTDGSFVREADAHGWRPALIPATVGLPFSEGQGLSQLRTRFLWLGSDSQ